MRCDRCAGRAGYLAPIIEGPGAGHMSALCPEDAARGLVAGRLGDPIPIEAVTGAAVV